MSRRTEHGASMRTELARTAMCAGLTLICVAATATQIGPGLKDEQRRVLEQKFPEVTIGEIRSAPIPGWNEVWLNGEPMYVSADARYLFNGRLLEIDTKTDLTRVSKARARAATLATVPERDMIVYAPTGPWKHQVTVFTDVSCAHCQQMQKDMDELNRLGVKVRLLALPRHGRDTRAWRAMEAVWCSRDRKSAILAEMNGEPADEEGERAREGCEPNLVAQQYDLAHRLHIVGTPTIVADSGEIIGGYLKPERLFHRLEELRKRAQNSP